MKEWCLQISDETDRLLRLFLTEQGKNESYLAIFVEEAVKAHLLELTITQIKQRNSQEDQEQLMNIIDEAVEWSLASSD